MNESPWDEKSLKTENPLQKIFQHIYLLLFPQYFELIMNSNTQSKDEIGSQSKHNHTYYNKIKNLYDSLSEKEKPTHDEVVLLNQYEDN